MLMVKPGLHRDQRKGITIKRNKKIMKKIYEETTLLGFAKVQILSFHRLKCSMNSQCLKLRGKTN